MAHLNRVQQMIVVGAGIGGLTLALGLARQGIHVRVFEQATSLDEVGAGLQLSPNAVKVLREFGLDYALQPHVFAPLHACIRDGKSGQYFLKSPLGEQAIARYGAPYWHVHRSDLHKELVQACYAAGVEIELNSRVMGYRNEKSHATILLKDRTEHADLIIGADGIRSKIRELMLGVQAPIFTGQVAWRGTVPVSAIKGAVVQPDATVWVGENQHLVAYYLKAGQCVNFVAVEERATWHSAESWREEGDVNKLRRKFLCWHPEVTAILEACDSTFLWALNGRPTLSTWVDGRVALLGDACHPMLPFMAQGAAMAIEDAYVLVQALNKYEYSAAFARYEQLRKPRATAIQTLSRDNTALYHMHGGWKGRARLAGLGMAAKFAPGFIAAKLDSVYGYDVTSQAI